MDQTSNESSSIYELDTLLHLSKITQEEMDNFNGEPVEVAIDDKLLKLVIKQIKINDKKI